MKRIRRIVRALNPRADADMSRKDRTEAYRIRRILAMMLVVLVVIVMMTSCSVHAMMARLASDARPATQPSQSTSRSVPSENKSNRSKKASKAKQTKKPSKTDDLDKQSQETDPVAQALSAQSASLSDEEKNAILDKAQQVAQNNGKQVIRYHYCVTTKGDVGSVDDFANAAFRILNDERGWPRAGAVFEQSTDGNCDFDLILSQASQMTSFSTSCSVEYSCRVGSSVIINDDRWKGSVAQWLGAGGDLARYRTMVINHEVGHRLGHMDNETTCAGEGQLAPLMQEQSIYLDGCKVNEYPLDSELWIG